MLNLHSWLPNDILILRQGISFDYVLETLIYLTATNALVNATFFLNQGHLVLISSLIKHFFSYYC